MIEDERSCTIEPATKSRQTAAPLQAKFMDVKQAFQVAKRHLQSIAYCGQQSFIRLVIQRAAENDRITRKTACREQ